MGIAYYRPKLRCRRTWMPIMLHCFDVLRINCYILYQETSTDCEEIEDREILDHKPFLCKFIDCLIRRANVSRIAARTTRLSTTQVDTNIHHDPMNKICFSVNNPSLDIYDELRSRPVPHYAIPASQKECCYCRFLYMKAKAKHAKAAKTRHAIETTVLPKSKRPRKKCNICRVNLCDEHFGLFHSRELSIP